MRITTPTAAGLRANSLTEPSLSGGLMSFTLTTKRLPRASKARAAGPVSPVRVAVGVVLPGELAHRVVFEVGDEEVAVGVERQGDGPIQPCEGGGGVGCCPAQTRSPCCPVVGDEEVAVGVEGQGGGPFSPVRVAVGVVMPGGNSLTVLPLRLATKRSPRVSKARAMGSCRPRLRVAVGLVLPGELAHRGASEVGDEEVAASVEGQGPGDHSAREGGGGGGAARRKLAHRGGISVDDEEVAVASKPAPRDHTAR